jgi:hypothetical protein
MLDTQHAILIANNYDLQGGLYFGMWQYVVWHKFTILVGQTASGFVYSNDSEDKGRMFHEMLVNFYQTAWCHIHKIVHFNLLYNFCSPLFVSHTCWYTWNRLVYHSNISPARTQRTENLTQHGQLYRSQPLPSVIYSSSWIWAQKMFLILCSCGSLYRVRQGGVILFRKLVHSYFFTNSKF